ncbi:9238_t:CDS:2 [Paraglomus occultum]|uniref:9238_t:CDS:1 n=1 Tax=Paraglomus occultum TaxID=144539 RepID=A0A9N8YV06_9GLOM|nr:9238_t:CDS:2 [Paraglomus occultum]
MRWTSQEDKELLKHYETHGPQWQKISCMSKPHRSPKSVRQRYLFHLCPGINTKPLTIAERQKIITLSKEYGHQWSKIAKALEGRTSLQVKNFWHNSHRNQPEKMSIDYIVN